MASPSGQFFPISLNRQGLEISGIGCVELDSESAHLIRTYRQYSVGTGISPDRGVVILFDVVNVREKRKMRRASFGSNRGDHRLGRSPLCLLVKSRTEEALTSWTSSSTCTCASCASSCPSWTFWHTCTWTWLSSCPRTSTFRRRPCRASGCRPCRQRSSR